MTGIQAAGREHCAMVYSQGERDPPICVFFPGDVQVGGGLSIGALRDIT
jgi:hypothetical protein